MAEPTPALANAGQIEALADKLSDCADEIHHRLMQAIKAPRPPAKGGPDLGIDQAGAQALFESELVLRQRANSLYADAATCAVSGMEMSQQQVMALTENARRKIAKIVVVRDMMNIAADLVDLAAAAGTGNASRVVKALENLKHHSEDLEAHRPDPPA